MPINSLANAQAPLQLWGGVECSVVRVGDHWRDQLRETGHHDRGPEDLARLCAIGIRTLRYPVLWERVTSEMEAGRGWDWHDRQLGLLRDSNIDVLAGLIHHGSGPAGTNLLDPLFPEKFSHHAGQVAARYPWIDKWVPVNEPLTTARFSCLYGHWYPHHKDEGSFIRATVIQARAALLAMRAIRSHAPSARFVHTEDIGRVFSTPPMRDQAIYENERRWLSLDLLFGKVDRQHPWRVRLENHGVSPVHLDELATGEAMPNLVGVNHYVTSDRFLDHRTELYPTHLHASNGRENYVDTEAVRVHLDLDKIGWLPRLREVWDRYQWPMVVTEAHLGCDAFEEQAHWLIEAWDSTAALRREGVDIRAITAWALFGLMDWDSLLCKRLGHYEPGVFDASQPIGHAGPLAAVIADLAGGRRRPYRDIASVGWWRRDDRIHAALRTPTQV